jgi:hypothetical protein
MAEEDSILCPASTVKYQDQDQINKRETWKKRSKKYRESSLDKFFAVKKYIWSTVLWVQIHSITLQQYSNND